MYSLNVLKELYSIVFASWFSFHMRYTFLERRLLIQLIECKQPYSQIEYGLNLLGQDYQSLLRSMIEKIPLLSEKDALAYTKEEVLLSFIVPASYEFLKIVDSEIEFSEHMSSLDNYHRFKEFKSELIGVSLPITTSNAELSATKYKLHSIKLYEAFVNSIEGDYLADSVKKLNRYIYRFTEDETEASELISLTFLRQLKILTRRMSAMSKSGLLEVNQLLLEECRKTSFKLVENKGLDDSNFYSLYCFCERYMRVLKVPSSYTSDSIIAQSADSLSQEESVGFSSDSTASIRLKSYEIISQFYDAKCRLRPQGDLQNENVKNEILEKIEHDFNELARRSPNDWDSLIFGSGSERTQVFNILLEYLSLAIKISLRTEERTRIKFILKASVKDQFLSYWISTIDCLIMEKVNDTSICLMSEDSSLKLKERHGRGWLTSGINRFVLIASATIAFSTAHLSTSGTLAEVFNRDNRNSNSGEGRIQLFDNSKRQSDLDSGLKKSMIYPHSSSEKPVIYQKSSQFEQKSLVQHGVATWSGYESQYKKTASGEPFDRNSYTASHQNLPFHSLVEVTNLEDTNKSVVVEINDRTSDGGEIINLAESAARAIGIIDSGRHNVRLEVISCEGEQYQMLCK